MSKPVRIVLSLVLLAGFFSEPLIAQDAGLAAQVHAILKSRCAGCHAGGINEGGFGYALSRRRLVRQTNGLVVPDSPDESLLYRQVRDNKMPQGGEPLAADQKETIRRWIAAGAPDWEPAQKPAEFISPEQMFAFMQADLEKEIPRNRRYLRYFTITHLKNGVLRERLGVIVRLKKHAEFHTGVLLRGHIRMEDQHANGRSLSGLGT